MPAVISSPCFPESSIEANQGILEKAQYFSIPDRTCLNFFPGVLL